MSAYRFVTLTCDGCGQIWDDGTELYVRSARVSAARAGWTTGWDQSRRRTDRCGVCSGTHWRNEHGDYRRRP